MTDNLDRFIEAQNFSYETALSELTAGAKRSHWIWYIFPQIKGLGHSWNSNYYGLDGLDEAREYLSHPILGPRLRECCQALLEISDKDIVSIMSGIDAMKLKSSMTLFDAVSPEDVFSVMLEKYFSGMTDDWTLSLIRLHGTGSCDSD